VRKLAGVLFFPGSTLVVARSYFPGIGATVGCAKSFAQGVKHEDHDQIAEAAQPVGIAGASAQGGRARVAQSGAPFAAD